MQAQTQDQSYRNAVIKLHLQSKTVAVLDAKTALKILLEAISLHSQIKHSTEYDVRLKTNLYNDLKNLYALKKQNG